MKDRVLRDFKAEDIAKVARLTATLRDPFAESARLEAEIRKNLTGLGYDMENRHDTQHRPPVPLYRHARILL